MNQLQHQFIQQFAKQFSKVNLHQDKFLVAISGGIDSVVLAHLMKEAGVDLHLAHCNFQLRASESNRDEDFVRSFADNYNIPLHIMRFGTAEYATKNKLSIQEAARNLRYQWFNQLRSTLPIKWLLTAHHADDNIETAMMHFFRGTGLKGLTGIPAFQKEQSIIRPLLPFYKEELIAYALAKNLRYVEDSSNKKDEYTRNIFRLNILPQIKQIYPKAEENILQNINRFKDVDFIYASAIEKYKKKLLVFKGHEVHIPLLLLKKTQPLNSIIWEIIKDYGFKATQTFEVIKLLEAQTGSYTQSYTHRIILNRNWLMIVPNNSMEAIHIQIEQGMNHILLPSGELKIDCIIKDQKFVLTTESNTVFIDAEQVEFPLLWRPWKQGDYFYPLGMTKKKKLSRFFIDQKLSLTDKEKVMVIESKGKIIWVVGLRIDNRYCVKPNTINIYKLSYKK